MVYLCLLGLSTSGLSLMRSRCGLNGLWMALRMSWVSKVWGDGLRAPEELVCCRGSWQLCGDTDWRLWEEGHNPAWGYWSWWTCGDIVREGGGKPLSGDFRQVPSFNTGFSMSCWTELENSWFWHSVDCLTGLLQAQQPYPTLHWLL